MNDNTKRIQILSKNDLCPAPAVYKAWNEINMWHTCYTTKLSFVWFFKKLLSKAVLALSSTLSSSQKSELKDFSSERVTSAKIPPPSWIRLSLHNLEKIFLARVCTPSLMQHHTSTCPSIIVTFSHFAGPPPLHLNSQFTLCPSPDSCLVGPVSDVGLFACRMPAVPQLPSC